MIQASDGLFYGMTDAALDSTIYRIDNAGAFSLIHSFGARVFPNGLMQASDGNFYGTTGGGGVFCCQFGGGTLFKMSPTAMSRLFTPSVV